MITSENASRLASSQSSGITTRGLRRHTWSALGTVCEVQFASENEAQAQAFVESAISWVAAFEAKYSRFRPASLVSRINIAAGVSWSEIDEEMEQLLNLCDELYFMTQGILDPTMLPLIRLWDYKAEKPVFPTGAQIGAAVRLVGWRKVQRAAGKIFLPERGMGLDFGGFGKEDAV